LTAGDNLKYRAALYGITGKAYEKRLGELCAMLDLQPILKRQLFKLSGGQKRRVDIARALLHNPEILILDEPTTGLDPQTRKTIWSVVEGLRKNNGMTVLLTTHYSGVYRQLEKLGVGAEAITSLKTSVDCDIYFFGNKVEIWVMYLVLVLFTIVCIAAYVIINALKKDD